MCGIVGYIGDTSAAGVLIPALRRLEYRGYDSAGIATLNGHGIELCKAVGKIAALEAEMGTHPPQGSLGIAHTRWATHGRPTLANAHPHLDCRSSLAIVHNGIIDNYHELRSRLEAAGHRFQSETDTEAVAHLIEQYRDSGLVTAVERAAHDLRGSYAIVCIAEEAPETLIALRRGSSPLVIGPAEREVLVASDVPALVGRAREMIVLGDGEMAVITPRGLSLRTLGGCVSHRRPVRITSDAAVAERQGYPHFMLKEIMEQPDAVRRTLEGRLDGDRVRLEGLHLTDRELSGLNRLLFVACGSSLHAALVGKYAVEALARLPVDVEIASEFRTREPVLDGRVLTVAVTQSGETADTLGAIRRARQAGARIAAISNVAGSSAAREAESVIYTHAGLEIGVAATKTFTTQVAAVLLLALRLGEARGMLDETLRRALVADLRSIPGLMDQVLAGGEEIDAAVEPLTEAEHALFLGRGLHYPLALEGALKLKEISYIHAEGYAAGEMKHGPIALITRQMPVVAIAPRDDTYEKMTANIEEARARDARVIAIRTRGDEALGGRANRLVTIPRTSTWLQPLLIALPLQLIAYRTAVARGCDVDQPRNLAKSVTVE